MAVFGTGTLDCFAVSLDSPLTFAVIFTLTLNFLNAVRFTSKERIMAGGRTIVMLDGKAYSMTKKEWAGFLRAVAAGGAATLKDSDGCKDLGRVIDGAAITPAKALEHLTAMASGEA